MTRAELIAALDTAGCKDDDEIAVEAWCEFAWGDLTVEFSEFKDGTVYIIKG